MDIIKALILRDIYEYKNNPKTVLFCALLGISTSLWQLIPGGSPILMNTDIIIRTTIFFIPYFIAAEVVVAQTYKYIQNGIYEMYFINKNINKLYFLIAKFILLLMTTFVCVIISFLVMILLNKFFGTNAYIIIDTGIVVALIAMCMWCSSVGMVSALFMKNEKSGYLYILLTVILLVIIFKIFDYFNFYSELALALYFVVMAFVFLLISIKLLTSNRFISR